MTKLFTVLSVRVQEREKDTVVVWERTSATFPFG